MGDTVRESQKISKMKLRFHLLLLFLSNVNCKTLKIFSSHNFGPTLYGPKPQIKDYVTLVNDPKSNIPHMFSICSSVFLDFITSEIHFIEIIKEDGSHWFDVSISTGTGRHQVNNTLSEEVRVWYQNIQSEKEESDWLRGSIIPIVPHSWYHICMGLDTVSGLVRIVVNGREVFNEENEGFRNTVSWKPKSLAGKVTIFKGYSSGFWVQFRSKTSNFNIFKSMMTVEDMVSRTSGGKDCSSPGDYLRYQ